MMTTEKNARRELVDNYIRQYSPYKSQPLGVNVSAVLKLSKEKKCPVKNLSKEDINALSTH